jgi:hypothetical protein
MPSKIVGQVSSHLQSQERFADATRSGEGEWTDVLLQEEVLGH